MQIRPIRETDNQQLGALIQQVLKEFKANKPGTAYYDDSLYELYQVFSEPASAYWVAEEDGKIIGGGGLYPTAGLPDGCCELVKLYLLPEARGKGIGGKLMTQCLEAAPSLGYSQVYLETMPELTSAIPMYEKLGFTYLSGPLGQSGHFGCSVWMLREV
ncbi:GNAT family N-acetyltransferase [Chitinophaga solisilvae]|uniref:GNAT family N-acetyltransferase n=1 Tax=Chitinophaga solisilvae TaxID=1233460 RepID=UPI001367CDCD|nr:GNAT family N-acetyltransferase [Chitinophaga solisilvae]